MRVFLDVPYESKEEAKKLGAKWNARVKKWYVDTSLEEMSKYQKWLFSKHEEVILVFDSLFLIEGKRSCFKCGKTSLVVALGVGECARIFDEEKDGIFYDLYEDYPDPGEEIHLAWVSDEKEIPPKLLAYLKKHYSVKMGRSKTAGPRFANHCEHCGVIMGNWFLFHEPDSPFSTMAMNEELIRKMKDLKIYGISLSDSLLLNWDVSFGENDFAYLKYGNYQDLILTDKKDEEDISYEELYVLEKGAGLHE